MGKFGGYNVMQKRMDEDFKILHWDKTSPDQH